ncbi:protein phosphatase 2c, putative [Perkinsus marinus ATCC 50983]|uniref:protein-serine/threonine phosphatase n=1 Tax=Perkinsus marinus (strain ATCC 50983 / TXsc) TaxID=423536 RepID=C5K7G1_PERM5|nr:protein phosphatase 2c, putative [Perkinsus marinus ATCC 50983]EER19496.1 protein phosphatase 2c, putative [Perkinsus marinus ATCC 50983]|eukprot:XP_002787700.1 protein phosphatase 2c, putative [Perkinsus marinus ATCC 50983]
MGAYLSSPKTAKESSDGRGGFHSWGCSEVQGWRTEMEDAHVAISGLEGTSGGVAMFGVYDGHGGCEVAKFVEKHLPEEVAEKSCYLMSSASPGKLTNGDLLVKGYHRMDELLRSSEFKDELAEYRKAASGDGVGGGKARFASLLQSSIVQDLAELRERETISRQDAKPVMMKMFVLKRLEASQAAAPSNSSTLEETVPPRRNPCGDLAGADEGQGGIGTATRCGVEGSAALQFGSESGGVSNVGCTAVTALLTKTHIVVANAGDSRAILCVSAVLVVNVASSRTGRGGRVVELSHDHKPNSETERRRIEAAGGYVEEIKLTAKTQYRVNGNLNLSRAIGDHEYKKRDDLKPEEQIICSTPDIVLKELTPEDEFFVLACDGVWDVMSNEEVVDFIRPRIAEGQKKLSEIVEELLDHCIADDPKLSEGIGGDNMTCILVKLERHDDKLSSASAAPSGSDRL